MYWLDAKQASGHYLNQYWSKYLMSCSHWASMSWEWSHRPHARENVDLYHWPQLWHHLPQLWDIKMMHWISYSNPWPCQIPCKCKLDVLLLYTPGDRDTVCLVTSQLSTWVPVNEQLGGVKRFLEATEPAGCSDEPNHPLTASCHSLPFQVGQNRGPSGARCCIVAGHQSIVWGNMGCPLVWSPMPL